MQKQTSQNNQTKAIAFPIFDIKVIDIGDILISQDDHMWTVASITSEGVGIFPYSGGMQYIMSEKIIKRNFAKLVIAK